MTSSLAHVTVGPSATVYVRGSDAQVSMLRPGVPTAAGAGAAGVSHPPDRDRSRLGGLGVAEAGARVEHVYVVAARRAVEGSRAGEPGSELADLVATRHDDVVAGLRRGGW